MVENVENKTIEQRKGKDSNQIYMEVRDFILEEKNQSENIKELGEYLNKLPDREYNEIKQTLQYIMEDPEIVKIFEGAGEKVKENKDLTDDEKSIIYLSAVLFGKGNGFKNIGKFDLKLPIEKICDGQLLAYIQKRYNNYSYNPNKGKEDRKTTVVNTKDRANGYRNPNIPNPIPEEIDEEEKVENEYQGLPQIPLIRGKEYVHEYCNKILKWAEDNGYLSNAEYESRLRNEFRQHYEGDFEYSDFDIDHSIPELVYDKDYEAYVKYDKLLYAFGKYCEVINKKHEELVKKAGYWDLDEFAEEMKYIDGIQEYLKEKYPDLDETMERVKPYFKEMEENRKKYFGGKTEEEVEKAGKEFGEYKKYEQEKIEEYGITEETIKSLCEIPKDEKELEAYLKNLNAYILYQNETEGKKREYGENIDKYLGYIKGIQAIRAKYGEKELESDLEMIKNYMDDLESSGKMYKPKGQEVGQVPGALTIFDKFNKYSELMGANPELSKDLKNMKTINEVLSDPTGDDFWITEVKNDKQKEKKKQEERDRRRNNWYEKYPVRYELLSTGASIWNTFINFTVGTGTSLGAMICGMILGKKHYQSSLQRKERWDSSLTIGVTREQQEGIYDSETGKITLNWKNGPYMVASSVTNMYLLILGGDAAGKGVSKIFSNIGRDAVGKAGLFSMSFITQAGQSYTEAMNAGLEGNGAFIYSMLTATAQSSLELVSPNEVLLGKGTGVGKEMVRALCKGGNKGGIKLAGKYFLKTMFREMGEEILQEEMQLAAGNLINDFYNGIWDTDFESDWGYKNFLATAMITAMTTGIATGISSGGTTMQIMRGKNNKLIEKIFTTEGLYEDVMKVLENAIKGEQKIPDVKIEQLEELKMMLEHINTIQEQNNNENQNTAQENKENKSIEQNTNDENNENSIQKEETESQEKEASENSKNKKKRNKDYFDGQPHEFDVTQDQAIENSQYMDNALENVINESDEGKLQELINDIKEHIEKQYEQVTGQKLNLTEEQVWSILEAHSEDGILGELTRAQLYKKVRPLTETIADENVRRFLLEAGFCGKIIDSFKGMLTRNLPITNERLYMEKNVSRMVEKGNLENYNIVLYIGLTQIKIEKLDNGYMATNLSNGETFLCEIGSEYTVGRKGYIKIDESDKKASKEHLKIKIDENGNIIFKDISKNGTEYVFIKKGDAEGESEIELITENESGIELIPIDESVNDNENYKIKEITNYELDEFLNLKKGQEETDYINEFGEPKNSIILGNGIKMYTTNCLNNGDYKYIVGYVIEGGKAELRLFYRSRSEGFWRSCPGFNGLVYSKGEGITNSSYETTTRVLPKLQENFDKIPIDEIKEDPIRFGGFDVYNKLNAGIKETTKVNENLFEGFNENNGYIGDKYSEEVKKIYRTLGKELNLNEMKIQEGKGYTYEHPYLGTIEVKIGTLNINGRDVDFSFAKAQNDKFNRVRVEDIHYPDAKMTSFGIYDNQINGTPLNGKPVDHANNVPIDMKNNKSIGDGYIDIRNLYQENPIIKKYKEICENKNNIKENTTETNTNNGELDTKKQIFEIGKEIKINLNDGTIISGTITEYDENNGMYKLEWNENGKTKFYYFTEEEVNSYIQEESDNKKNGEEIGNLENLNLTTEQKDNITKLIKIGIQVDQTNVEYLKALTPNQINNIVEIEKLEIKIDIFDIESIKNIRLDNNQKNNIKKIIESGIDLTAQDVNITKDINLEQINNDFGDTYEGYEYQDDEKIAHKLSKKGNIIENIEKYVESKIKENRDIKIEEILNFIRPQIITLPTNEKVNIISGIIKTVRKFNTIRKFIDFNNGPYKSPKQLICAASGYEFPDQITENITVKQRGSGIIFYVRDNDSYGKLSGLPKSGGSSMTKGNIRELEGTICIINGTYDQKRYDEIEIHEGQHCRNLNFMIDNDGETPIVRAKDEITAYLRGGASIKEIESYLTSPNYQYGLEGEKREQHKAKVRELLTYANNLIELTKNENTGLKRDNVISMLANAHTDIRKDLNGSITEAVKLHIEEGLSKAKVIRLKDQFCTKIRERAGNNNLINNIIEFWNSLFPNYGIKLEEFWWAGTAKKETVMNSLENCNSIEEVKHILNDPQYSHIGRGQNNLGGIEISMIIDEVVKGKLPITQITGEIRPYIEKFINNNTNNNHEDTKKLDNYRDKKDKRLELSNSDMLRGEDDIPGNFTSVRGEFFIPSLGKTGFYKLNGCMDAARGDEDLRELISSKFLEKIGFPHADIILTQNEQGVKGALSVNILNKDEEFVVVETDNIPDNLDEFIERDLKTISTIPGVNSKTLTDRKDYLIKYVMISALIGNTDIKMDNMFMVRNKKNGELRNAEYYDMGIAFNDNPNHNRFFRRYSPEDIIREIYEKYPEQAKLYGKVIERNLTRESINDIVNEEIFNEFDPDVKKSIIDQLKERIELIKKLNNSYKI